MLHNVAGQVGVNSDKGLGAHAWRLESGKCSIHGAFCSLSVQRVLRPIVPTRQNLGSGESKVGCP